MKPGHYPNVKSLIYGVLENAAFDSLKDRRKKFIANVLKLFAGVKGRINFLQMSRLSGQCEQYFSINFENKFSFQHLSRSMFKDKIAECVVAFALSFISKSVTKTCGLGSYRSGCTRQAKRWLEICRFAAVDIALNTAFHLNVIQTKKVENQAALQRYCQIIKNSYLYFKDLSSYMVADACFAKKEAMDAITACCLHFISRLQKNAVLYYINNENYTGKRG